VEVGLDPGEDEMGLEHAEGQYAGSNLESSECDIEDEGDSLWSEISSGSR
jgi:hypothetical protein